MQSKRRQAGADCLRLLEWLELLGAEVREAKGVALLRKVFSQQYEMQQSGQIEPVKVHASGIVQNPHDADVEWSAKGHGREKKEWKGYKIQVAETVASQEDQSSFIASVVTQRATESDDAGLPATLQKQKALGLDCRRSCIPTGLTSRDEQSKKPKRRGGNWWDRLNQALLASGSQRNIELNPSISALPSAKRSVPMERPAPIAVSSLRRKAVKSPIVLSSGANVIAARIKQPAFRALYPIALSLSEPITKS